MKKGMSFGSVWFCFILLPALLFLSPFLYSETTADSNPKTGASFDRYSDDDEDFANLISIIDKYTEIATKTKLNVDFVPGMVTVMYGEDLEVRGIQNLWEALKLVPGMDISVNNMGLRHVLVRGIGNSISSGNLKFQMNGISMNSALWGKAYPILDMPVEQIERVEVIRGPGSAVHGEFASTGVVNVITRKDKNSINAGAGQNNSYGGSVLLSIADQENGINVSLNAAAFKTDGGDVIAGPDQLYGMGMGGISNAPGPTSEARDVGTAVFDFSYKKITVTGYYLESGNGDYFGLIGSLPPEHSDTSFIFKNYGGQVKYTGDLIDQLHFDVKFGFFKHRFSSDLTFEQPPGFMGIYPDGVYTAPFYEEGRLDGELDFTYSRWSNNTVMFGMAFSETDIDKVWHDKNYLPSTNAPLPAVYRFSGSENWLAEGKERSLFNLFFQDEIKVSDVFSITAGLRFDHYSDVGSELSPRIAALWRLSEKHIIKTQYARAFCPPTFNQMYAQNNLYLVGNSNIGPETIETAEISYLYLSDYRTGRLTAFYSDLDDLIASGGGTYSNTGATKIYGVEIEMEYQLMEKLKMDGNISFSSSENSLTGDSIPEVADWLGDLGIVYEPTGNTAVNIQYGYVGKRNRAVTDERDRLMGYHTVDTSFSFYNVFTRGLTLRAGLKNLFDEDVYYASPQNMYSGDFPRSGRQWWTKINYEF